MILADWAALAVENARLHEDAARRRAESERAVRRLEATAAIARAVGSETDLDRVLELIVKRGRALLDARSVVLLLVEGDQFHLAAGAGQVATGGARRPLPDRRLGDGRGALLGPPRADRRRALALRISERDLGCRRRRHRAAGAARLPQHAARPAGRVRPLRRRSRVRRRGGAAVPRLRGERRDGRRDGAHGRRGSAARTRSPRPSRSGAAGRASCTTRRCRRSAACRCCCRRRCAGATPEALEQRCARRSSTSAPRSRACAR